MTLVVTALTQRMGILVADRRLTSFATGNCVDDYTNKVTQYCGHVTFAYSGISQVANLRTDEWLAHTLATAGPETDVMRTVQTEASQAFSTFADHRIKRHAFVALAWARTREGGPLIPGQVTVSNALDSNGQWLPVANGEFTIDGVGLGETSVSHVPDPVGANVPASLLEELRLNIRKCAEHGVGPLEYLRLCVGFVRQVARQNSSVGSNLLAVVLPRPSEGEKQIHFTTPLSRAALLEFNSPTFLNIASDVEQPSWYGPNFVCNGTIATEVQVIRPGCSDNVRMDTRSAGSDCAGGADEVRSSAASRK